MKKNNHQFYTNVSFVLGLLTSIFFIFIIHGYKMGDINIQILYLYVSLLVICSSLSLSIKRVLFLLWINAEIISYNYNFFNSLNIFLILMLWFNFVYTYFGLTAKEEKLRKQYPIKFNLSLKYFYKVFERYIKIKYLIIKDIFTCKNLSLKNLIQLIIVIGISLIIVRYFRSVLLIEIIEAFNLDKYYYACISVIGAMLTQSIMWITTEIRKVIIGDEYMYDYLLWKDDNSIEESAVVDKLKDLIKSPLVTIKDLTFSMLKAGQSAGNNISQAGHNISQASNTVSRVMNPRLHYNFPHLNFYQDFCWKINFIRNFVSWKNPDYFYFPQSTTKIGNVFVPGHVEKNLKIIPLSKSLAVELPFTIQYIEMLCNPNNIEPFVNTYPGIHYYLKSSYRQQTEAHLMLLNYAKKYVHTIIDKGYGNRMRENHTPIKILIYEYALFSSLKSSFPNMTVVPVQTCYKFQEPDVLLCNNDNIRSVQLKYRSNLKDIQSVINQFLHSKHKAHILLTPIQDQYIAVLEKIYDEQNNFIAMLEIVAPTSQKRAYEIFLKNIEMNKITEEIHKETEKYLKYIELENQIIRNKTLDSVQYPQKNLYYIEGEPGYNNYKPIKGLFSHSGLNVSVSYCLSFTNGITPDQKDFAIAYLQSKGEMADSSTDIKSISNNTDMSDAQHQRFLQLATKNQN